MARLLPLALLILALPGLAGAQPALRGTLAAQPAESRSATPALVTPPASLVPAPPPVAGVAGQCRLTCAQSYYFCLADTSADDCGATWGQCRVRCDAAGAATLVFPG